MATAKILIVDDDPAGRQTLEGLLSGEGYILLMARSGQEALRLAAEHDPDVVLLDLVMPGMDGLTVCRRLREDPRLGEVPVLLVTAMDDQVALLAGLEAGADDLVSKPVTRARLRAQVRAITRLGRYRSLISARAQLAWVVEQAQDGYLGLDESYAVVSANPAARRYLGIAEGDIPGPLPFIDLCRRGFQLEPLCGWQDWERHSEQQVSPRFLVRPQSDKTPALWLEVREMHADGVERLVALRDVTARRVTAVEQWQFHRQVGHKLRTPWSGMVGVLDLLFADGAEPKDLPKDELRDLLCLLRQSGQRMGGALDDVLSYLGTVAVAKGQGARVGDLLELAPRVAASVGVRAIEVTVAQGLEDARLPLPIPILEQILREILENAHKFHPDNDPQVEVEARFGGDGLVVVEVRDDGPGLPQEQLERVFWPYYQVDPACTGEIPGMGLGLPMAASLLWRAGGTCRARNRGGGEHGLVVEISLPL